MKRPRRLRKLLRLRPREYRELAWAQWALLRARALVRVRPTGKLISTASGDGETTVAALSPLDEARARRLALAVERVAENGVFRPLCLVRAVAIEYLLTRHGISGSRIRIGVRQDKGGFAAHAWVERGDLVLGDRDYHVESFAPLSDVRVLSVAGE